MLTPLPPTSTTRCLSPLRRLSLFARSRPLHLHGWATTSLAAGRTCKRPVCATVSVCFIHAFDFFQFHFFVLITLCLCLETECAISLVNCRHISSTSRIVGIYMEYGIAIYTIQHIDGLLTLHVVFARCPSLIASCSLVLTDLCSLDVLRRWVDSMLGSLSNTGISPLFRRGEGETAIVPFWGGGGVRPERDCKAEGDTKREIRGCVGHARVGHGSDATKNTGHVHCRSFDSMFQDVAFASQSL